ncbi:MAG: hypothetical protein GXY82_07145 [Methanospirillum sp.]|nr:hypothetical protein [Methanospirillum sp.]
MYVLAGRSGSNGNGDVAGENQGDKDIWVVWLEANAGTPPKLPGGSGLPRDTDADGKYDDVNGNGGADFADIVLYFNLISYIAVKSPLEAYDYNGNGRIDFADVTWLFAHL